MVAGHDTTLAANDLFLKEEFGVEYEHAVYGSSQIYELWKNEVTGKYFIKYLVNQEEKAEFDFEYFKEKVWKKIYTEEQVIEICDGVESEIENKEIKVLFFICLGLLIVCLIAFGLTFLFIYKNK